MTICIKPLAANMVISVGTVVSKLGDFGVRVEDTVVVVQGT